MGFFIKGQNVMNGIPVSLRVPIIENWRTVSPKSCIYIGSTVSLTLRPAWLCIWFHMDFLILLFYHYSCFSDLFNYFQWHRYCHSNA